jgi:hypothetical protein
VRGQTQSTSEEEAFSIELLEYVTIELLGERGIEEDPRDSFDGWPDD